MSEQYQRPIFYNPKPVIKNLNTFKEEVVSKAYKILLEQKYKESNKDWACREPTTKSLEWILNKCQGEHDVKIVHRMKQYGQPERLEIVFVNDWYFAWCDLKLEHLKYFETKYEIKRLN